MTVQYKSIVARYRAFDCKVEIHDCLQQSFHCTVYVKNSEFKVLNLKMWSQSQWNTTLQVQIPYCMVEIPNHKVQILNCTRQPICMVKISKRMVRLLVIQTPKCMVQMKILNCTVRISDCMILNCMKQILHSMEKIPNRILWYRSPILRHRSIMVWCRPQLNGTDPYFMVQIPNCMVPI